MNKEEKVGEGNIHILVVDDEKDLREVIREGIIRATGYDCSIAESGEEGLTILEQESTDVVISDIKMPGMSGLELAEIVREKYDADIMLMSGYVEEFTFNSAIGRGACDFIQKPVALKELVTRLRRVLHERSLRSELERAVKNLQKSLARYQGVIGGVVKAMALTVETRDPYTAGHQQRVADLAYTLAKEVGLSGDELQGVRMGGIIHDLGKIAVPAEILSKPTSLSDLEFSLIKGHSEVGYNILKDIDFPWPIADMVLQHHERINGSGYPNGLSGDEILIEAKILGVADVVEAMSSHRPYRPSLGIDAALDEIERNKGVLYDSRIAEACLMLFAEKRFDFKT